MRGERGSVTIWMLGLSLVLFALGGLSIDLWRILAERRTLSAAADAAAIAVVSAIDLDAYRDPTAEPIAPGDPVPLDQPGAVDRVRLALARGDVELATSPVVEFLDGGTRLRITLESEVEFTLLRILTADRSFRVRAEAEATAIEVE